MSARTALRSAGSHLSRRLGRRAGGIAEVLGRQTGLNRTERCDVVRRERPDQRRDPVDSADIDEHARVDVVDLQLWLVVREADGIFSTIAFTRLMCLPMNDSILR